MGCSTRTSSRTTDWHNRGSPTEHLRSADPFNQSGTDGQSMASRNVDALTSVPQLPADDDSSGLARA